MTTLSSRNMRSLSAVSLAIAGIAALAVAPAVAPGLAATAKTVVAQANLLDTESWIMGGSGMPIPPPSYLDAVSERFINPTTPFFPGQPTFQVDATNPLFTPEGLYPLTGVKSLELDPSLQQGVSILNSTITNQIADGNSVVVLGYSQSAIISGLEMNNLLALPQADQPTADQLAFSILGSPSNPDGGLLERFNVPGVPLSIPSVGITFSGAIPADTPWDTAVYTQEYDGFADFPKYPINFLADINAFAGILLVHGKYPVLTDAQMASAVPVPTTDYTGPLANTQYFMIPTDHLPMMDLVREIPLVGNPLADLLEPDLKVLVNLGYGSDPDIGWSTTGANLPTSFGLFPSLDSDQFNAVLQALGTGAQQGVMDFLADLSHLSAPASAELSDTAATFALPSFLDIVNAFSGAAAAGYAALLPTADIANFMLTTVPAYATSIFMQELTAGDLVNAIGLPIAATTGLATMAAGFELEVLQNTASEIAAAFSGLS